jgi:methyl-accepting chemotaxis protein
MNASSDINIGATKSLKTLVLAGASILILGVILIALWEINTARSRQARAERYNLLTQFAGYLNAAAGEHAKERGAGVVWLTNKKKNTATETHKQAFEEDVVLGEDNLTKAEEIYRKLMAKGDDADLRKQWELYEKAHAELNKGRENLRGAATIDADDWRARCANTIASEFAVRSVAFAPQDLSEKVMYYNMFLRHNIANLCEFAGRERALLASPVAGKIAITPKQIETLTGFRSIVDESIKGVLLTRDLNSTPSELKDSISNFETEFIKTYGAIRGQVYAASAGATESIQKLATQGQAIPEKVEVNNYPVDGLGWYNAATRAISSGLAVAAKLGEIAERGSKLERARATTMMFTVMVTGVIFTLLVVGMILGFYWRILNPIVQLGDVANRIAQGDATARAEVKNEDEVGRVAQTFNDMVEARAEAQALIEAENRVLQGDIQDLLTTADQIAKGDTNARAPAMQKTEINRFAQQFNGMMDARVKIQQAVEQENKQLQSGIQQLLMVLSDASDGDLSVRAKVTEGALGNISDAMNLMLENVGGLIAEVRTAATRVASGATEIQASSEQLSEGSVKQASEITNTTSAVQEMAANTESVSNNANAASEAALRAQHAAEDGTKSVGEVVSGMERIRQNVQASAKKIKRLGERSMEISTIVNTISQISAQTDMLALNAAIEAARAGEHGRGFTVVAEEVRKLAERAAAATKEIEKLIAGIQAETNESVTAMEKQTEEVEAESKVVSGAGDALEKIRQASIQSAELINEINLSAKQQVRGATGVVKAMEIVSNIAQQAQSGASQTKRATETLSSLSSELNKSISRFKVQTNGASHK